MLLFFFCGLAPARAFPVATVMLVRRAHGAVARRTCRAPQAWHLNGLLSQGRLESSGSAVAGLPGWREVSWPFQGWADCYMAFNDPLLRSVRSIASLLVRQSVGACGAR